MGVDLLDIEFRLERMFRFKITRDNWESFVREKTADTITAADIEALVIRKVTSNGSFDGLDWNCVRCGYNLRGLPRESRCHECGSDSDRRAQIWNGVRAVLRDTTGASRREIRRDSRLKGDLGASF
jgi:hypothetical protein